jgi:hypothetical protein
MAIVCYPITNQDEQTIQHSPRVGKQLLTDQWWVLGQNTLA